MGVEIPLPIRAKGVDQMVGGLLPGSSSGCVHVFGADPEPHIPTPPMSSLCPAPVLHLQGL